MNRLSQSKDEATFASTTPENHTSGVTKSGCCAGQVASPTILKYTPESRTLLDGEEDCGASGNVVVRLSRSILHHLNTNCFMTTTSLGQSYRCSWQRTGSFHWAQSGQTDTHFAPWSRRLNWKKEGRGAIDEKTTIVDGVELSAVRWYDNKAVTLPSTYAGSEPVTEVTRWNNKSKSRDSIKCPNAITVYNKHMGGVDLIDSLIGLHRIRIRSKKMVSPTVFSPHWHERD